MAAPVLTAPVLAAPPAPRITIRDLNARGVYACGRSARAAWAKFVARRPGSTFFHRVEWADAIAAEFGWDVYYRMAWAEDPLGARLVGVLPLHHVRAPLTGSALVSTAYTVGGGVLAETPEAAAALAEDAQALADRLNVGRVELRSETADLPGWAVKETVYATFRGPLAADPDARLAAIPRKKRADVRKAIAAELTATHGIDPRDFHRLYAPALRDHGTPIHRWRWWARLAETFGDDVLFSSVSGADGRPLTTLMSFFHGDAALPYAAGALPSARRAHAFERMYWALMERAAERGARTFEFGRSRVGTGAYAYKSHWGFQPVPLAYQYWLRGGRAMPNLNPDNPKYRLFVGTWKRLPVPLTEALGPWFARQLA